MEIVPCLSQHSNVYLETVQDPTLFKGATTWCLKVSHSPVGNFIVLSAGTAQGELGAGGALAPPLFCCKIIKLK